MEDQRIDSIQLAWEESPSYSGPRLPNCPPDLRVLRDFLETRAWASLVPFIAPGVLQRAGRVREQSGFLFPTDMDPDDEPFDGVMLFDPLDTIYLSAGAFDRLMSRYFQAIIGSATRHQHAALHAPWWPEFLAAAQQLQHRAGGAQP